MSARGVDCPAWCVVEPHDPEQVAEGWAWHHGVAREWETTRGTMTVHLSCTTGLDALLDEADIPPYVTLSGTDNEGVLLSAEIDLRDNEGLIAALIDLRSTAAQDAA